MLICFFFFTANLVELSQLDEEVGILYFNDNDNLKKYSGKVAYNMKNETCIWIEWLFGNNGRSMALTISALNSRFSCLGSSPGWGHWIVFLGKLRHSHSASPHPIVEIGIGKFYAGGSQVMD